MALSLLISSVQAQSDRRGRLAQLAPMLARQLKGRTAAQTPILLTSVGSLDQRRVVHAAVRTLSRESGIDNMPTDADVRRGRRITNVPRILRPEHLAATRWAGFRSNERIFAHCSSTVRTVQHPSNACADLRFIWKARLRPAAQPRVWTRTGDSRPTMVRGVLTAQGAS
jgi:hypothetical protein